MSWMEYIDNLAELINSQADDNKVQEIASVNMPKPADPITDLDDIQKLKDYFFFFF